MRALLSLGCLLLLLLTLGGRALFLELRLAEWRSEMRSELAQGRTPAPVIRFSFTMAEASQLSWLDAGEEFEWQGQRYDVLTSHKEQGRLVLQAVSDDKETGLVADFRHQCRKEGGQPASVLLLKLAATAYLAPDPISVGAIPTRLKAVHNGRCLPLQPQASPERGEQPPRNEHTTA